jgi:outer membrane protein assembly factor BamB
MRNAMPTTSVMAVWVVMLGMTCVSGQDWPQWRGPNRDAKAADFNAPKTWPKELTQKWKVPVGGGDATPALVGDKLYVFTREGGDEVIRCLDAATGKEVWQDKYEAQPATGPAGGMHAGPRSSPAVADGKVVTLGVRGTVSCLDAASGKKLWRKEDFKGYWPMFFTASSPIVVDGLCIVQLGGKENGRGKDNGGVVAYDLAGGDEKWKWTGGGPGYASPVLMKVDGTNLIVAETDHEIVALTATDGKPVWKASFTAQGMGAYNASTPVVDGQILIYGGGSGRGEKAVKIEKEGDGFVAKELWSNKENSPQFNSPVVKNGLLVGLTQSNQFYAIDTQNGQTAWTAAGGQPGGGRQAPPVERGGKGAPGGGKGGRGMRGGRGGGGGGYGSIVDAGSVLLALTPGSELMVFEPSDKGFKQVAKYKVASTPTYAYPVVSGNRVFIKDQDSVTLWTID